MSKSPGIEQSTVAEVEQNSGRDDTGLQNVDRIELFQQSQKHAYVAKLANGESEPSTLSFEGADIYASSSQNHEPNPVEVFTGFLKDVGTAIGHQIENFKNSIAGESGENSSVDKPSGQSDTQRNSSDKGQNVSVSDDIALSQKFKQVSLSTPDVPNRSPEGAKEPTLSELRAFVNNSFAAKGVEASIRQGAPEMLCVEASAILAHELNRKNFNFQRVEMRGEIPKEVEKNLKRIGADPDDVNITKHWYLRVKTKDQGMVIVDPTVSQFFKGGGIDSDGNPIERDGAPFVGKSSSIVKAFDENHARRDSENFLLGSKLAKTGSDLFETIYGRATSLDKLKEVPNLQILNDPSNLKNLKKLDDALDWHESRKNSRV